MEIEGNRSVAVKLIYESSGSESGYPGNVQVKLTYTLTKDSVFYIDYEVTLLTMTNHSYFNVSGQTGSAVHEHRVEMNCSQYAELGDASPRKHLGVCFETQASPAALWLDGLASITLGPGETSKKQTRFRFGIK